MTEPSGRPRRRRWSGAFNPLWGFRRPLVALGALAIIIVTAAGLSIALSGGVPGSGGTSSAVPAASVALATSSPTVHPSSSSGASGSTDPSLPPISGPGIRAGRIQIARLGIDLAIIDGDGIDAPVDKAAHYTGTGWPDGKTNIYIYAHARPGIFLPLWGAIVGDRVELLLVDGSKRSYVVDQVLPDVPWDAVQYLQPTPTEQLTLQTSTAPDESAPRFVVIAHPAP